MNILLILKGIIIGIGKIIPGVSGSVMAISFGVYDTALYCVTHFFDDIKNNIRYLLCLGIGVIFGIVFFSKIIVYFLNNYYVYTMILFIGLIMGGVIGIYKRCDNSEYGYFLMFIGFILFSIMGLFSGCSKYIVSGSYIDNLVYFISGIVEGVGTIIPGISSTAMLMMIGVYDIFIYSVSNLLDISYVILNIKFLCYFGFGLFISIIMCIYIINYLFLRYRKRTFSFILGIILSNILFLLLEIFMVIKLKDLIIGILLLGIGFVISLLFDI